MPGADKAVFVSRAKISRIIAKNPRKASALHRFYGFNTRNFVFLRNCKAL